MLAILIPHHFDAMITKNTLKNVAYLATVVGATLGAASPLIAQYRPYYSFWQRPAHIYQSEDILPTLADTLAQDGEFETLRADLSKAGLMDMIEQGDSFTIFAPTDDAFDSLSYAQSQKMADPEYRRQVLSYHIINHQIKPEEIPGEIETLTGKSLRVTFGKNSEYEYWVNEFAQVTPPQIRDNGQVVTSLKFGRNGVIVPINKVLLPSSLGD